MAVIAPRRLLVTGASGFIGRRLVPALALPDQRLRILARRPLTTNAGDTVEISYAHDLGDTAAVREALRGVDVVVHLASVVHRRDATIAELTEVNVKGTRQLAEQAAASGVSHLIFVSSIAAVGAGDGKTLHEQSTPEPTTPYGASKLQAERELFRIAADTTMVVSVLRPPMVYGPGMKGNPLRLFRALAIHVPLPFAGAGNPRSSLFVDNLVAAIRCLTMTAPVASAVYHVADREILSTEGFARASARALGVSPLFVPSSYALLRAAARLGESLPLLARLGFTPALAEAIGGSLVLDTRRLARETGFTPPHSLHDGLAVTARWFRTAYV